MSKMKDQTPDLANMTVEDLFQAKAERRRRLTNLPFEKKIEIVKRIHTRTSFDKSIEACVKEVLSDIGRPDPDVYVRITSLPKGAGGEFGGQFDLSDQARIPYHLRLRKCMTLAATRAQD
jgi:hypothetical protein